MKNLTEKAKEFLSRNPTHIGNVGGHDFYEHPALGDESPLICITKDGRKKRTEFWELPMICELETMN